MKEVIFKIKRFDGNKEYTQDFKVNIDDRTTILEVLTYLKEYVDPSLTFRAQCRAAICGTCGVMVNDTHVLACKTKVIDHIINNEILIQPENNLTVIKDLVVDHSEFLEKLKKIKGWFEPKEPFEPVYPDDLKQIEKEADCILCGLCYSACPAFETDKMFGGPIDFVKIYRFWKDKNDKLKDERIVIANENHITSCVHCKYCTMVCPQQIPVEMDITQIEFYGQQKGIIEKKEEGGFGFGQGFGFDMF